MFCLRSVNILPQNIYILRWNFLPSIRAQLAESTANRHPVPLPLNTAQVVRGVRMCVRMGTMSRVCAYRHIQCHQDVSRSACGPHEQGQRVSWRQRCGAGGAEGKLAPAVRCGVWGAEGELAPAVRCLGGLVSSGPGA